LPGGAPAVDLELGQRSADDLGDTCGVDAVPPGAVLAVELANSCVKTEAGQDVGVHRGVELEPLIQSETILGCPHDVVYHDAAPVVGGEAADGASQ